MIYKRYIDMINVRVGLKTLRIEVLRNAAANKRQRQWQTDGAAEREITTKLQTVGAVRHTYERQGKLVVWYHLDDDDLPEIMQTVSGCAAPSISGQEHRLKLTVTC